jgi:hypothetical protein
MRNPKPGEALKLGRQQRAAPNINVMRFRCDEPKAKLRRVFSCGKTRFFAAMMRRRDACSDRRGCHGFAEKFSQICRAPVRFGGRLNEETTTELIALWPSRDQASARFSSRPDSNDASRAARCALQ